MEGEVGPRGSLLRHLHALGGPHCLYLNFCGKMGKEPKEMSNKHGTLLHLLQSLHQTIFRAQHIYGMPTLDSVGPPADMAAATTGGLQPRQPPHLVLHL